MQTLPPAKVSATESIQRSLDSTAAHAAIRSLSLLQLRVPRTVVALRPVGREMSIRIAHPPTFGRLKLLVVLSPQPATADVRSAEAHQV
jgi:hypothetical protein